MSEGTLTFHLFPAMQGFQHRDDLELVFAEVEPRPNVVGYPRFQFLSDDP